MKACSASNLSKHVLNCAMFVLWLVLTSVGQQNAVVPNLVNYSGVLTSSNGMPMPGTVGVTFALYAEQQGGAPLWLETQNVQPNKTGHYSVQLGAASSQGLPPSLFAAGEARWLGVQAQGEAEQPRTLLMSVPYALKALDAETIGGKPASAFMLAPAAGNGSASPNSPQANITGGGTADYIPMFTGTTTIGNSKIYQNASHQVGINTISPAANLDVGGTTDVRDTLTLFPNGSHSSLSVNGTAFQVNSTGKVTFVSGQTFPGTGTVTSVGSGAGLTGGPITGSGTLSIKTGGVTNTMLANSTVGVKTSGPLTGGGTVSLGGSETLGLQSCSANQILEFVSGTWTCVNPATGTITQVTAGTGLSGGGNSGNVTLNNTGLLALTAGTGLSSTGGQSPTLGINTSVVPELGTANNFTGNLSTNGELAAGGAPTGNVASGTIEVDAAHVNNGSYGPGLLFAGGGEGIASNRNTGANQYGLNFFTDYTNRMAITNAGLVGIGSTSPSHLLEVDAPGASTAQMAMVSTGTDAAISLNNTNTGNGGREYWIDSGATGAGVGGGNFAIWDNTAGAVRMVVNEGGAVGIGGFPDGDDQLEIDSAQFVPWAVLGNGWSAPDYSGYNGDDGIYGFGGYGDLFSSGTGGGWGLFGVGGEGTQEDGVGGLFAGGDNSSSGDGVYSNAGSGYAGNFNGNVNVTGALYAGTKYFKIDHPLDPANKYLLHASVESSEMMNIYSGNVTTDASGEATVKLPDWFEALNGDFRYQLTVMGTFAQAIIAHEMENGEFAIRTSAANVKVSWQVTAVRHDAFAKAHPLVVEEEKEAKLRGFYIHPELYGAPAEKQIEWARNPHVMKTLQERNQVREKTQLKQKQAKPAPAAMRTPVGKNVQPGK